jgi:hypothetical protein
MNGYSKDNTVILDDYDEVYKTQPKNCIIAESFEFNKEGSENDKFLENLTLKLRDLKEKIDKGESVQKHVKDINKK